MTTKTYKLGDFLNDINVHKENLLRSDEHAYKDMVPFIITLAMSQHIDTILLAREVNLDAGGVLSKEMVYDFYINGVRKRKRWGAWAKASKDENVELVKSYYGLSTTKAIEALKILTDVDLTNMKRVMDTGGKL